MKERIRYQDGHADGILDHGEGLRATYFTGTAGETPGVFRREPLRKLAEPALCAPEELEYASGYLDGYAKAEEWARA